MAPTDEAFQQMVLGELRALRRAQDDMDLRLQVDAIGAWKHRTSQWLDVVRSIPPGVRWCLLAAIIALGWGAVTRNGRVVALGADLAVLALLFVGGDEP